MARVGRVECRSGVEGRWLPRHRRHGRQQGREGSTEDACRRARGRTADVTGLTLVMMTLSDLKASLSTSTPPANLAPALVALWHDAKGDWNAAHQVAQDVDDKDGGAWVHAY